MPAPIVFRPQSGPLDSLLMNLFLGKIQHNYKMEIADKQLQAEKLRVEEERTYKEGRDKIKRQGKLSEGGWTETGTEKDAKYMPVAGGWYKPPPNKFEKPAYKKGQLLDFKVGDKLIQHKYENGKWVPTGRVAPRYKPTTNIYNQMSIAEKSREKDIARVKSSGYTADVAKDVKALFSKDQWEYEMSETQKNNAIRKEIGRRVRSLFPDDKVAFAEDESGRKGWYKIKPDGSYELIRPWNK